MIIGMICEKKASFLIEYLMDFASGAFIISDNVKGVENIFGDALVTYNESDEFNYLIDNYLDKRDKIKENPNNGRTSVINQHTYLKRVERILALVTYENPNELHQLIENYRIVKIERKEKD